MMRGGAVAYRFRLVVGGAAKFNVKKLLRHRFILFATQDADKRPRFSPFIWCILTLAVCWLLELVRAQTSLAQTVPAAGQAGARDFLEYWAAGRLFAQGSNPYSPAELFALQRMAGWSDDQALIMWNPPWTLPFVLPFGLPNFAAGQFFWLLVHVFLMLFSTQRLWRIYSNSAMAFRLPLVLAFTFVPTIFVLVIGQITPLLVAGLTAFLYSQRKENWPLMGAALVILSLKPHVLYLLWVVFPLWLFYKHSWRSIGIVALVGMVAMTFPLLVRPGIYSDYIALYGAADVLKPMDWLAPTLRNVIRLFFEIEQPVLQFAPTALAGIWAVHHWYHNKQAWRWEEQLPLLSIVSVFTSFFVWTYDQVVVLPAMVEAAVWISQRSTPWYRFWTARLYIVINACHLLMRFWLAEELWYFWLAPALLANYFVFRWEKAD